VTHTADWWLGRLDDRWFEMLEEAVRGEWGVEPLRIREGGVSCFYRRSFVDMLKRVLIEVYSFNTVLGKRIWMSCATSSSWSEFGK
jgi:hypothetical protein